MAALMISAVSFCVGMSAFRTNHGSAFHGPGEGVAVRGGFCWSWNLHGAMLPFRQGHGVPARKHHYVPQFYQKGFANADVFLCVYDRKLHTYKQLAPKVICRTEDLYTVKVQPGVNDTRIDTDIIS